MKNRFLLSRGFVLLLCCLQSFIMLGQTKSATVGTLVNNKAVLTDANLAQQVLSAGLPSGASVYNLTIIGPDDKRKYYLVGNVSGAEFSGKGIELEQDGTIFRAVDGPGLEVECRGRDCNSCVPRIAKWRVYCVCDHQGPSEKPTDASCDMTSKLSVTTW